MKKALLLLCILVAAGSGIRAQKSVVVGDSNYYSYADKQSGVPSTYSQHTYNTRCLDSITQLNYPRNPENSQRSLNSYYPNDLLYRQVRQVRQVNDTTAQAFVTSFRMTYTYNAAGQELTNTVEIPDGSGWKPHSLGTFHYDAAGRDTLYLYQVWNDDRQAYVNSGEVINTFDAAGLQTLTLYQGWNESSSRWEPYLGFYYVYDANGFLVSFSAGTENFVTGEYGISYQSVTYVNKEGLADSSYWVNNYGLFSDSTRSYYTYRPSTSVLEKTVSYAYNTNRDFTNGTVAYTYYDTLGSVRTDSLATYNFYTTPDSLDNSGFINVHFRDSTRYLFRDSAIQKNFTGSPDSAYTTFTHLDQQEFNESGQLLNELFRDSNYLYNNSYYRENIFSYDVCTSGVLPVTFLNFRAQRKDRDALLSWQTVNKVNTSSYGVERSTDGVHFTAIGKVMAAGNGRAQNNYSYTDHEFAALPASKVWYRLAEQSNTGKVAYSPVAELMVAGDKLSVSVTPNPVQDALRIYSPVAIPDALISVADMNGRKLFVFKAGLTAGVNPAFNISGLAKGMYVVTVQWQTGRQVIKIVK